MTKALALAASMAALERAQTKHPTWPTDPIHATTIIAEELGELHGEVLRLTYEPDKGDEDRVREEALDLVAAAIRFLISLDHYNYQPSLQHQQP